MIIYTNIIKFNTQIVFKNIPYLKIKKKERKKINKNTFTKVFRHRNIINTDLSKKKIMKSNYLPNIYNSYKYKGKTKKRTIIEKDKKQNKKIINKVKTITRKILYNYDIKKK
jgi:hypothetical protein